MHTGQAVVISCRTMRIRGLPDLYGDAVHPERQDAGCVGRTGFADPGNAVEAGKGGGDQTDVGQRINNDYPPFRNLSEKVASARMEGFDRDPAEEFLRDIATMDMQDISRFYQEQISGRPVVYVIAGNRKRIDMNKLAEYGTIVKVKRKTYINKCIVKTSSRT